MALQYDALTSFFEQYELASNRSDADTLLGLFADPFTVITERGPKSVRLGDFASVVAQRRALFDKLGCQETALDSLKSTPLNDKSALVTTTWRLRFLLPDGGFDSFVVVSSFLVYTGETGTKIFVYIPHQDIMAILAERGILPGPSVSG